MSVDDIRTWLDGCEARWAESMPLPHPAHKALLRIAVEALESIRAFGLCQKTTTSALDRIRKELGIDDAP